MELVFNKVNDTKTEYEASFVVNSDFNLHIETRKDAHVTVYVSTVENHPGQIAFAQLFGEVFDRDFCADVYPKYVHVVVTKDVVVGIVKEASV